MASYYGSWDSRGHYRLRVDITTGTPNISGNYTPVTWHWYIQSGWSYFQARMSAALDVGGARRSTWTDTSYSMTGTNTTNLIATGSYNHSHNPDGTGSVAISGWLKTTNQDVVWLANVSISDSHPLATIPRASSIGTITGNQIGSPVTVNISRASTAFTHQVWYRLPGQAWQSQGTGHTTSCTFTVPIAQSTHIASASYGNMEVAIQTKSGSTNIGGEIYKNHTMNVPASVVPSFTSVTASEAEANVSSKVGAYVQGKSRIKFTINGASGAHGSWITAYKIVGLGNTFSASNGTTGFVTQSGNNTATAYVTDSRNRTVSKTVTVNILPYSAPKLTGLQFYRSTSGGVSDPRGTSVTVKAKVDVTTLIVGGVQKNKVWYEAAHNKTGSYVNFISDTPNVITKTYSTVLPSFPIDRSFSFRVRAGDIFDWTGYSVGIVPTGEVTQHWGKTTTAFGKMIDNTSYNVQVGGGGIHSDGQIYQNNRQEVVGVSKITDGNATGVLYARVASFSTDEGVSLMVFNGGDFGTNKRQTGIISGGSRNNNSGIEYIEFTGSSNRMRVYTKNLGSGNFEVWLAKAAYQRHISVIGFHDSNQGKIEKNPVWVSSSSGLSEVSAKQVSIHGHTHSAGDINSGTIADARLPAKAKPADFVVSQSLTLNSGFDGWTRWDSGKMEQWGRKADSRAVNIAINGSYRLAGGSIGLHHSFVGNYMVTLTAGNYGTASVSSKSAASVSYSLVSPDASRVVNTVDWYAIGRWK